MVCSPLYTIKGPYGGPGETLRRPAIHIDDAAGLSLFQSPVNMRPA